MIKEELLNKAKDVFKNIPRMALYEHGQHIRLEIL